MAPSKRKGKQNNIKGKKPSTESTLKKKTPTCYNCGKVGHYSKDCQLENKINFLEINDKLQNLMIRLMFNKEEEKDSSEYYELEEENQILIT